MTTSLQEGGESERERLRKIGWLRTIGRVNFINRCFGLKSVRSMWGHHS